MLDLVFPLVGLAFLVTTALFLLRSCWGLRLYFLSSDSVLLRDQPERVVELEMTPRAAEKTDGTDPGHDLVRLKLALRQEFQFGSEFGTGMGVGASVWSSSLVLSQALATPRPIRDVKGFALTHLEGKTCLELGSGLGLCSIVANCMGPRLVAATDGDEALLPLLSDNVRSNEKLCIEAGVMSPLQPATTVLPLIWGNSDHEAAAKALLREGDGGGAPTACIGFDVIIGADIVYRPRTFEGLMGTLLAMSTPGHTRFLLGYKARFPTDQHFFTMLREYFEEEGRLDARHHHSDSDVVLLQYVRRPTSS